MPENRPGHSLCVIGTGPRGLLVLERLSANSRAHLPSYPVTVHIVDPFPPGPGSVWRTGQSRQLLMNTVASQVTVFTDSTVEMEGPLEEGPSLYEWAQDIVLAEPFEMYDDVRVEARALLPDSYPTRAFYGHYLHWAFRRMCDTAPDRLKIVTHAAGAIALDDAVDGRQTVTLDNGTQLTGLDVVVLTQGHTPVGPDDQTASLSSFAADHGLTYVAPANPVDIDLGVIAPGEPVLLRGLGLNFFDCMALLTSGRGGTFRRRDGRLVYRPSGREPQMYAASRRGIPHHARGRNEKGPFGCHQPLMLTREAVAELRSRAPLDFSRDIWPLVAKEVETAFYAALLRAAGRAAEVASFQRQFTACPPGGPDEERLLDLFGIAPGERWDWERVARPYEDRCFAGPDDFTDWLLGHLRRDVADARAGNVSGPVKAALDVMRDLRNEIRLLVDHGGLTPPSHRQDLDGWYTPLNAFVSIGPPPERIEQMAALVEAGVLRVLGPDARVATDPVAGCFTASSSRVPGSCVGARALVDARLPDVDLRRTADPLLRHLLETGQCRPYRIVDADGNGYGTGGLEVTPRPYHLVSADGRVHPRRFALGVPTESVHWVTAAGARPGVNSVTLGDCDAVARAALASLTATHQQRNEERAA